MRALKKIHPFELFIFLTVLLLHAYAALASDRSLANIWFDRDDAYYYFKVAQNIAAGQGSTFDGTNLASGYHPLWMLVCVPIFALARIDPVLPLRVLLLLIAVLQAVTAVLLFRLARRAFSLPVAMLAAAFWAFSPFVHATVYQLGLETPAAALFVVALLLALSSANSRPVNGSSRLAAVAGAAVLASLAMFSRLDLVFLAGAAGIWLVLSGSPARAYAPLDLVILFAATIISVLAQVGFTEYHAQYASGAVPLAIAGALVRTALLFFSGADGQPRAASARSLLWRVACAVLVGTMLVALAHSALLAAGLVLPFPRRAFLLDAVISILALGALRLAARILWPAAPSALSASPRAVLSANWKNWIMSGVVYYLLLTLPLAAYMYFQHSVFGTSSPLSGVIKRWWGSFPLTLYGRHSSNAEELFGLSPDAFSAWQPLAGWLAQAAGQRYGGALVCLCLAAAAIAWIRRADLSRGARALPLAPLLAGSLMQIFSYTSVPYVGTHEWYWTAQLIFLILLGSWLLDLLAGPWLKRPAVLRAAQLAVLLPALVWLVDLGSFVVVKMRPGAPEPGRPLMDAAAFLEANTPPGSRIGMTGGGNIGYYLSDRTIVNMDGLINSVEYFEALRAGRAPEFLLSQGVAYVFVNEELLSMPPYRGQFEDHLHLLAPYSGKKLFSLVQDAP